MKKKTKRIPPPPKFPEPVLYYDGVPYLNPRYDKNGQLLPPKGSFGDLFNKVGFVLIFLTILLLFAFALVSNDQFMTNFIK